MFVYSIIFPIISIIAIIVFFLRFRRGKMSISSFLLWSIIWIFVIIFSIFPEFSMVFADAFGITRGLDFIIIVTLALLFYFGVKLYYKIDKIEDDVNTIVKELAINNEIRLDDKEE